MEDGYSQIDLSSRDLIQSYISLYQYRGTEYNFTNLYTWAPKYNTEYKIVNDNLIIRFKPENPDVNYYLFPLGRSGFSETMNLLLEETDGKLFLLGLDEMKEQLAKYGMLDRFSIEHIRGIYDYIYSWEKLAFLKGKKMQSKRNHVNQFKSLYNWKYNRIENDPLIIAQCKELMNRWMSDSKHSGEDTIRYDKIATFTMLDHFDELNMTGAYLTVDDNIVAFTMGSPISDDTFDVHVEKALTDYKGSYAAINEMFVLNELSDYLFINREEDMDLESLRKAKMSYNPDILLRKSLFSYIG